MSLTKEQQDLVLSSEWVVNTVLKNLDMRTQDYRQVAMLFLCQAAEKFDESKHVKWTTFAYKDLTYRMKRYRKKEYDANALCITQHDEEIVNNVPEPNAYFMEDMYNANIKKLLSRLTKKELQVAKLRFEGYTIPEMNRITGLSISYLIKLIANIKRKTRAIYYEKEEQ